MDGIQLLSLVRERAPDTVRIMLTGNADLEGAIKVVNEGNIFRFLTKPCPPEILGKAVEDALAQYRLVIAEKELLNKTLSGSIKLLTDILSMMEPQSFGRAQPMRDVISSVTKKFKADNDWEIPLAVMLAPIGNVTIPPELLLRARAGAALTGARRRCWRSCRKPPRACSPTSPDWKASPASSVIRAKTTTAPGCPWNRSRARRCRWVRAC